MYKINTRSSRKRSENPDIPSYEDFGVIRAKTISNDERINVKIDKNQLF